MAEKPELWMNSNTYWKRAMFLVGFVMIDGLKENIEKKEAVGYLQEDNKRMIDIFIDNSIENDIILTKTPK